MIFKFRRLLLRFERLSLVHYAFKTLAYTMINLRHGGFKLEVQHQQLNLA
jgi:hypothetical protein